MRVLGIDPGSRFMGYGVVEEARGRLEHVAHGVIRAGAGPLEQRLKHIGAQLRLALQTYEPEAVAVEGVFTLRNPRSALILGHARGVALLVAAEGDLPVHEYSPARVKRAVGAGGADGKDAVARMVRTFLQVSEIERADASDALAVAICHLNAARGRLVARAPSTAARSRGTGGGRFSAIAGRLAPAYQRFGGARG
ncbi:MAG TPA: crossover junction endodeoxyribonuclease RuvC [Myxococcaceae bacterium]|nr:crossover junction endodeoxyribonuclease RuvC [Myxococcaceae bacterium]